MAQHISTMSLARRQLVRLLQDVGHGRIEGFALVNGEPVLDPQPRVVYELRLQDTREPWKPTSGPFVPKAAVAELLDAFTRIGNAHVAWIEVRNGLPTRFAVDQVGDERVAAPTGGQGGEGR